MKNNKKKLSIRPETVRALTSSELRTANGGGSRVSCIVATCTCPPTYNGCGQLTDAFCV